MGSPSSTGGIILGNYLVDGCGEVHQEIIFEVSGENCEVGVVGLGKLCDAVKECQEVRA